jgi:hypothetical protein
VGSGALRGGRSPWIELVFPKTLLFLVLSLVWVAPASAAVHIAPIDGAAISEGDSVAFQWQLDAGERAVSLNLADGPDIGQFGGLSYELADYELEPGQTSLMIPNWPHGQYWWQVETIRPGDDSTHRSTPTSFGVLDLLSPSEARFSLRKAIYRETAPAITITRSRCNVASSFDANCKWRGFVGDVLYRGGRAHVWFHSSDLDDNLTKYHVSGRYRKVNVHCIDLDEKPNRKCIDRKRF